MAYKTFRQTFYGYWPEEIKAQLPAVSGVYCVYAGTYNSDDTVTLNRILYIGKSDNIHDRIQNHGCEKDWKKELRWGENIIFSYTEYSGYDLERLEAALIYKHKPPVNTEYVYNFPYDETTISTSGCNALLYTYFTVYKTDTARSTLLGGR